MYHPKKKPPNKILWSIVGGILAIHLVALAVFGGIVLFAPPEPDGDPFEDPPLAEKIDPVQIEFKRNFEEKQQKTRRPKQKLQVQSVGNLAMPEVDIQVPTLTNNADVGRVGGGMGNLDGASLGVGDVSVELLDIKAKGQKFVFAINVDKNLLSDDKGGIPTYRVIKEDILGVVEDLPAGILMNVILYSDHRMEAWKPAMVPATRTNKDSLAEWIAPVNTSLDSVGVRTTNYNPKTWETPLVADKLSSHSNRSGNHIPMVTAGLLEQKPDAIFILSNTLPGLDDARYRTYGDNTPEEIAEIRLKWVEDHGLDSMEEYEEMREKVKSQVREKVDEFRRRENERREKAGKPPRVYTDRESHQLRMRIEKQVAEEIDNFAPGIPWHLGREPEWVMIDEREMEGFFERLLRQYYDQSGDERPQLNAIVFKGADEEVEDEEEDGIDDFVDFFDGDYRILKGLGQIDSEEYQ